MGFFSSLFGGSSPTLNSDIGTAGGIMDFGVNQGERNLGTSSSFYHDLLSGDPAAIGKILGPEFSTIQKQGQQQLKTGAEFNNRSGGTNAAGQTNIDTQRAQVEDLISKLTGQAATGLTGIGESELGTGLSANETQASEAEKKLQNEQGGLFGTLISGLGGIGLGKLGDLAGIG